jgi:hypothetical protein
MARYSVNICIVAGFSGYALVSCPFTPVMRISDFSRLICRLGVWWSSSGEQAVSFMIVKTVAIFFEHDEIIVFTALVVGIKGVISLTLYFGLMYGMLLVLQKYE